MVVLGAAVLTKVGKVLISRHFVEMNRVRVEGLLAAFPKLIGSSTKQHTFVETDSVRYVWSPLDTLNMVIVTNKSSNIIEDLETLRLLARLIPEYCASVDEDGILQSQFELIFAFDEAIALGYRENVKPEQIRTYTEMDSHEEKLFNMLQQHKMEEASRDGARIAAELDKRKRAGGVAMSSLSSETRAPSHPAETPDFTPPPMPVASKAAKVGGGPRATGMSLGNKSAPSKTNALLSALANEGELAASPTPVAAPRSPNPAVSSPLAQPQESVHVTIEEKVNVRMDKEGGLLSCEVLGNLSVLVQDPQYEHVKLQCSPLDRMFQLKINPKVNKEVFNTTGELGLTDPSRGVPVGSSQVFLKWRMPPSTDESRVPLMINCWPSEIAGGFSVNLDYELMISTMSLENVIIGVPLSQFGAAPAVIQVDGATQYDEASQTLLWHVSKIDGSSTTGTLEFESRGEGDTDAFFPINVAFSSEAMYSGLDLKGVADAQTGSAIPYSSSLSLSSDAYVIG